jgi:prophage antirepressor-like protein
MEKENTVQQFLNDNFGEVRTILKEGEIWFIADDVAKVLKYDKATDMTRNLDDDERDMQSLLTLGGEQKCLVINESGLYNAVLSITKRNPERFKISRDFKKWITKTVIPSIRLDGGYVDKEEKVTTGEMSEDELIYKAMQMMDKKIHRLEEEKLLLQNENAEMKPIVSLVDKFVNTNNCYDIGTYAKILESKELGRTRLFAWLRDKKILMSNNVPYQIYTKYFKVIPVVNQWTGQTNYKTLLKPIGITYIYNKLLKDGKVIEKPLEKVIEDLSPAV